MGPQQRKKPAVALKKKAHGAPAACQRCRRDAGARQGCRTGCRQRPATCPAPHPPLCGAEKKRDDSLSPSSGSDSKEEFSDEQEDEEDYRRGEPQSGGRRLPSGKCRADCACRVALCEACQQRDAAALSLRCKRASGYCACSLTSPSPNHASPGMQAATTACGLGRSSRMGATPCCTSWGGATSPPCGWSATSRCEPTAGAPLAAQALMWVHAKDGSAGWCDPGVAVISHAVAWSSWAVSACMLPCFPCTRHCTGCFSAVLHSLQYHPHLPAPPNSDQQPADGRPGRHEGGQVGGALHRGGTRRDHAAVADHGARPRQVAALPGRLQLQAVRWGWTRRCRRGTGDAAGGRGISSLCT